MAGLQFIIPTTFDDTSLPILALDPVMSNGALFLFDPSHSLGAFTGVPANGVSVPNIAWETAAEIVGAGDETSLGGVISRSGVNDTRMRVERSSKGGLHGLPSQVNQVTGNSYYMSLAPAALIQSYIHDNVDHNLYFSAWMRLSRKAVAETISQPPLYKHDAGEDLLFVNNGPGQHFPSPGDAKLLGSWYDPSGQKTTIDSANGSPIFLATATTEYSGAKNPLVNGGIGPNSRGVKLTAGNIDAWASFNVNKAAGLVMYRMYIEDLTVSGRKAEEVQALDFSLYAAATSSGGRFSGDTFTSAAFP